MKKPAVFALLFIAVLFVLQASAQQAFPVVFVVGWDGPTQTDAGETIEADGHVIDSQGNKWPTKTLASYSIEIVDQASGTVLHTASVPASGPGKRESYAAPELQIADGTVVLATVSGCNDAAQPVCSSAAQSPTVTVEALPVPGEVISISITIQIN